MRKNVGLATVVTVGSRVIAQPVKQSAEEKVKQIEIPNLLDSDQKLKHDR